MARKSLNRCFWKSLNLLCLFVFASSIPHAQGQEVLGGLISPGALAAPHAGLEGVSNCTKCHDVGKKVPDRKCLACHIEIATRLEKDIGYHARFRDRDCVSCHSDHRGRDYAMVRWEGGREKFDHTLTGYRLVGKHVGLECNRCHRPEFVRDDSLKQRPGMNLRKTLLGVSPACQSCHPDEHRGQLSLDCGICHGIETWNPAVKFSHDKARYRLVGKHISVECATCHPRVTDRTATFVRYTELPFQECTPCHHDVHKDRLGAHCQHCHSVHGWRIVFSDQFDHGKTRYPLEGKHLTISCEKCHGTERRRYALTFTHCADCHTDVHRGEFARLKDKGTCETCHTVEGFLPATYDIAEHQRSRYPLTGSHIATACNVCHVRVDVGTDRERTRFIWDRTLCSDCHRDVHKGQFAGACEGCHQTSSWRDLRVDHNDSRFRLTGKHAQVACDRCHPTTEVGTLAERAIFTPLSTDCHSCHRDIHYQQFTQADAKTACERCHTTDGWKIAVFDHNTRSRFQLTGAHEKLHCEKCHPDVHLKSDINTVLYKPIATACSTCHRDTHGGIFRE